jgi:hypothetical protein
LHALFGDGNQPGMTTDSFHYECSAGRGARYEVTVTKKVDTQEERVVCEFRWPDRSQGLHLQAHSNATPSPTRKVKGTSAASVQAVEL